MGLGRSIKNWFKSIFALFTGKVDSAREGLDSNPAVIKAKYDDIIRDKIKSIQQYKKAIAALVAQEEKKMNTIEALTKDVTRLETLKAGAAAKAKQVVARLKEGGADSDAIHKDAEYKKCLNAFNDFSSTLKEKQTRIEELEADVAEYSSSIGDHKVQLTTLMRSIDDLKQEAAETVADMMTAKEEKEIGDLLSGIAVNSKSEELQELRDLRGRAKAEARIAKEVSGMDAKSDEAAFMEYAEQSESSSEFDALIGLEESSETAGEVPEEDTKLPE